MPLPGYKWRVTAYKKRGKERVELSDDSHG